MTTKSQPPKPEERVCFERLAENRLCCVIWKESKADFIEQKRTIWEIDARRAVPAGRNTGMEEKNGTLCDRTVKKKSAVLAGI